MKFPLFIALVSLVHFDCFPQKTKSWFASIFHDDFPFDSNFVTSYPTKPLIKIFVTNKSHDFFLKQNSSESLQFKPGRANGYGFGIVYHQIALELSFTPPQKFDINQTSPNGRLDINTTVFNNRFGFDVLFQNYKGYILDEPEKVFSNWPRNQDKKYIRNDLISTFIGLNHFYVHNPIKFSYRSSFMGDQIQHKSAGSFLYGFYFNAIRIKGKEPIISDSTLNTFTDLVNIKTIGNASIGFMIGYGFNIVFSKGFFISFVGMPGMGIGLGAKSQFSYFSEKPQIFPQFMLNGRASLGYNNLRWHCSFQWLEMLGAYDFGNESRISINQSKFKLSIGYRIQKPLKFKNKLL